MNPFKSFFCPASKIQSLEKKVKDQEKEITQLRELVSLLSQEKYYDC